MGAVPFGRKVFKDVRKAKRVRALSGLVPYQSRIFRALPVSKYSRLKVKKNEAKNKTI